LLPVSSEFIEVVQRASFSAEDASGRLGPVERLRLGVVLPAVVVDGGFQIVNAGVTAAKFSDPWMNSFEVESTCWFSPEQHLRHLGVRRWP
jgi:hypothetical protein